MKHGTNLGLRDGCGEIIRKYMDYYTAHTTPITSHFECPEMTNATPILHLALPSEGGTFPYLQALGNAIYQIQRAQGIKVMLLTTSET